MLALSQRIQRITLLTLVLFTSLVLMGSAAIAQSVAPDPGPDVKDFCQTSTKASTSSYCSEVNNRFSSGSTDPTKDTSSPIIGPGSIIYKVIQTVTTLTGALSVIMIMVGGFRYVTSGGDSSATKGAKDTILYAVVGLVVAIFSQTIITFVLSKL